MNTCHRLLLLVACIAFPLLRGTPSATPSRLDSGWRFALGEQPGAEQPAHDDRGWRTVDLPHDWSIEDRRAAEGIFGPHDRKTPDGSDVGYLRGGIGWYRRTVTDAERPEGSGLELIVEGAQQECDIWVNGSHAAFQPHGYLPVRVEIGAFLRPRPEPNVIAIRVTNPERNSRWYSGSGLYRGVTLRGHGAVHVPAWGARLDTLWLQGDRAGVQVSVEVRNTVDHAADITAQLVLTAPDGATTTHDLGQLRLAGSSAERIHASLWLKNVQPWTPDQPRLYRARVQLRQDGRVIDETGAAFGVRTITVGADRGLLLNGTPVKLRGGCVHHDNGLLGARAFADAERRRVRLLKANGFNAVRCAHNPPSTAFLTACDEEGMLVIDEFADSWQIPKKVNGYQRYFDTHADRDLATMLARDFNHPSVILWSIGNEIPERFNPAGVLIAERLAGIVHREDPRRPVTAAINGIWEDPSLAGQWSANDAAFRSLDVGGYNYVLDQYEGDHARHPLRVMCGTESYPLEAWENWTAVERLPYLIGDFVWSAIDYIGESGIGHTGYVDANVVIPRQQDAAHQPWPVWNSWCGDLDLIGDKKPQSYYRDVTWRRSPLEILVHEPIPAGKKEKIGSWGWPAEVPSWNWTGQEGRALLVSVYTRSWRVQLTLNGKVIGEQAIDPAHGITARFSVPWMPGTLTATALDGTTIVAVKELRTTGAAAQLQVAPETPMLPADRGALLFVPITVTDAQGDRVPGAAVPLRAEVTGEAELCAFGSADPAAVGSVTDAETTTFRGRALVILRSTGRSGPIQLKVTAGGLPVAVADLVAGNGRPAHADHR